MLRWAGWFGSANAAVYALILLRYFQDYPFSDDLIANIYVLLAFIGHAGKLAFLPLILAVIPLLLLWPRRRPVIAVAVILASIVASLLMLDANVFAEYRYHLTWLTFVILEPATLAFAGVFLCIALVFEGMLGGLVWRRLSIGPPPVRGRWPASLLLGCLLVSQFVHVWADAVGHTPVLQLTRYMPFYHAAKGKRILARLGLMNPQWQDASRTLNRSMAATDGELSYPLAPLQCHGSPEPLPNILIIMIDALRPDTVRPELMPNLAEFGRHTSRFAQHFSGGNSTRTGMFSLFYGLPVTYWQSFYALQRSPLLMDQVRDRGYQVGLFSAIGFASPMQADRTVFASWPGLPGVNENIPLRERNQAATDDWLAWLGSRNLASPFFSYLHYAPAKAEVPGVDAGTSADATPADENYRANTQIEDEWLRYRRAMALLDQEFDRVLDALQKESLLESTIVIVTSDHGTEFDDNGLGYTGHGTAFSSAQLMAPMMLAWPGREPASYAHRTSHYDLPTTLLQDVFACDSPAGEYGIGRNLYAGESWPWIIAGSYSAQAILQPEQVIVSYPGGFVEVRDQDYQLVDDPELDVEVIREAMESKSRFFK